MTLEQLAEYIDRLEAAIHALPYGDARDRVEAEHEELLDEYNRRADE